MRLLIVGNTGGTNVGGSLLRAAQDFGFRAHLLKSELAMAAPSWLRHLNWRLRGHRPTWLGKFSLDLLKEAASLRPECVLATGPAPCHRRALETLGAAGIRRVCYLTDDPFNPSQRAKWFLEALPHYDHVFSPRRGNISDLVDLGCRMVSYLPFGYDPNLQYADPSGRIGDQKNLVSEVMFAGGADRDRVPYVAALIKGGFRLALYGDYWERFPETRKNTLGHADPPVLREAIRGAKVALCLVRRANRDGHSMRTFEIPAIGTCMLTEDTAEHREIFGPEGEAVVYFRRRDEMVEKLKWLLAHDEERERLAEAAHQLITRGRNTYKDRLLCMLGLAD